jgi:hypothetical protein
MIADEQSFPLLHLAFFPFLSVYVFLHALAASEEVAEKQDLRWFSSWPPLIH